MDDLRPGYDVKSDDVRLTSDDAQGVTDQWIGNATVTVSNRQFNDGRHCNDPNIEYWLYVVDCLGTQTARIRAFRNAMKAPAHFYFQAQDWLNRDYDEGKVDLSDVPIAADSVPESEDHSLPIHTDRI